MKAASIGASSRPVLPPIIPETEKEFLESIQDYIISEIEKVGCTEQGPAEEYYIIYRNVFEKIIEHVNTYKGILTTIKQEYDAFIEAIKKGQRNAFYLHGKLKVLACEPSTLMYYKKRITQLEEKIKRIERNSARIENLIQKIRTLRLTIAADGSQNPTKKVNPAQKIPGLNLKDSFDISALSSHLAHLQQRTKELKEDMLTKYIPLENTVSVEKDMKRALHLRNVAEKENESLKFCSPFQEQTCFCICHLSLRILYSFFCSRFNELFSRGQYEAAAIYAANCPRGILCNEEALEKFRAVGPIKGKTLPLLMYCEALVSTAIAVEQPLPTNLTTEAIKCALSEKRLDLVMHWVTLHRLEFSEAAGDAIYKYAEVDKHNKSQCLALAQIVYGECGAHRKAALCLCKQGQIFGAMDYLHQCKPLPTGRLQSHLCILSHCPTVELIRRLTQEWNGQPSLAARAKMLLLLFHVFSLSSEFIDVLERMIVNDSVCSVEGWKDIAETCLQTRREKLARLLISVLAAQEGVVELPLDDHEDAKLMEHIFM
uniref:Clathrin heavy chain linker domain-containing protein 1 n=1 Tax=Varanus komodoensis TaxID=61221 RepID=A0A8D2L210_VARKO